MQIALETVQSWTHGPSYDLLTVSYITPLLSISASSHHPSSGLLH